MPLNYTNTILRVLEQNRLAVLSTHSHGQPHASLIAFSALEGLRFIAFATYRDTLKYSSIIEDRRVALLIEDRVGDGEANSDRQLVLTAAGEVVPTPSQFRQDFISRHLARHPQQKEFLSSPDCEVVLVSVRAYQIVGSIEDVKWYSVKDLEHGNF